MDSIAFSKLCRPFNIEYRDLFGYIPVPADYICTQEEFLEALKKSIAEKKEISDFLKKHDPMVTDGTKLY